ncbi:MAG: hypothetical protein ACE5PM_02720 [Candidatus Hydrothermarchaeales archaeon]
MKSVWIPITPHNTSSNTNLKVIAWSSKPSYGNGVKSLSQRRSPHIALLNLDMESKDYNVVWEFSGKHNKWCVSFEEI